VPVGGVKPWVAPISASDNGNQGTNYNRFRVACNMKSGTRGADGEFVGDPGDRFIALPLPASVPLPSVTNLCNGKTS
jgi:hypothetical protein